MRYQKPIPCVHVHRMIRFHLIDEVIVTVWIKHKVEEYCDASPVEGENSAQTPI